jgi:hypothetical protein
MSLEVAAVGAVRLQVPRALDKRIRDHVRTLCIDRILQMTLQL